MKNPLVVGYKGEIGSFLLQGLLRTLPKADNIWCVDINDNDTAVRLRIKWSDVIFLCIPIDKTVGWFSLFAPYLKNKIVVEQTSLKSVLFENKEFMRLNRTYKFNIISMHILFRPSVTPNIKDRKVVLIDDRIWKTGLEVNTDIIRKLTRAEEYYYNTYQCHDRDMAYKQALTHRVLLSLDRVLSNGNANTFIGERVNELATRIRNGDITLYRIIQKNKYTKEALTNFDEELRKFKL